jgi:hypothetical protein
LKVNEFTTLVDGVDNPGHGRKAGPVTGAPGAGA